MSLSFEQTTGKLWHGALFLGVGYSGHGPGLGNPAMEKVVGVGPIPRGLYRIGAPKSPPDHLGPLAMPLVPIVLVGADGLTDVQRRDLGAAIAAGFPYGRSAFFLHGDNALMNHTASDGCIVAGHLIRLTVDAARAVGDDVLEVIA